MPSNDQKLIADHDEVVRTLRLYKNIALINTAGEPVDEYDIEYRVKGYTVAADGRISVGRSHRIKIKIPFGYPHFPPTVRPLTPLFHPEIDDHVIPIAGYWQTEKSLPHLILHIGEMICGKYTDSDNPINAQAARFYAENSASLPLDTVQPDQRDSAKPERKGSGRSILAPLLYAVATCAAILLAGAAGLFAYDKWHVEKASDLLEQAQIHLQEQDFTKARDRGQAARQALPRLYVLRQTEAALLDRIDAFLHSPALVEGLKGNIRYGDAFISIERAQHLEYFMEMVAEAEGLRQEEKVPAALEAYAKALQYADEQALNPESDNARGDYARLQMQALAAASDHVHGGGNLPRAIAQHTKAIDFYSENERFLAQEEALLARIRNMLLVDQIALYSKEALEAESRSDYQAALDYHNRLIDVIGKAGSTAGAAMKSTLRDSIEKTGYLTERLNIERKRQWLVENYKEIFLIHYPTILPAALRNPQAIFLKYDGESMVFDINCLEKGSGSIVRLKLYYQYTPSTDAWSVYDGVVEDAS